MASYRLFALELDSELDFPELVPASRRTGSEPEVRLRLTSLDDPRPDARCVGGDADPERDHWFGVVDGEAWFDWRGVARVRIAGGERIDLDPAPDVDRPGLRSAILGPVFSVLLVQRGLYPLHASSVALAGERPAAVAFAAASGSGKSTLALALAERGHAFLADDVTALEVDGPLVRARPAYPQAKLLPDLIEHRGEAPGDLPPVDPTEEKRAHRFLRGFGTEELPLARVYLLGDGELGISGRLGPEQAFFEALRHAHRPQLLERVAGHDALMQRCARLAERVPFHRLTRPRALARLGRLARLVEEHAAS